MGFSRQLLVPALAASFVAGLAGTVSPAQPPAQPATQAPTFRAGTRVVPLYVTVTDNGGRLVPGLTKDDFEIFDDQKPQAVSVFLNEIQPITVVVMLDTSGSMTGSIDLLRAGAEQFLLRLLPRDRAAVGDFNDKIQFVSDLSSDRAGLVASLKDVDFGNPTRLYDAIDAALDRLHGVNGRKVVLVFTDGDDTDSRQANLGSVMTRARDEEAMVYAIGLQSDYFDGMRQVKSKPDRGLKKLAEETGGGYFELERTDQLTSTFTRVSEELHSQYVLGFTPSVLDGKPHKLEVRVRQAGMKARARKSYIASPEKIDADR